MRYIFEMPMLPCLGVLRGCSCLRQDAERAEVTQQVAQSELRAQILSTSLELKEAEPWAYGSAFKQCLGGEGALERAVAPDDGARRLCRPAAAVPGAASPVRAAWRI